MRSNKRLTDWFVEGPISGASQIKRINQRQDVICVGQALTFRGFLEPIHRLGNDRLSVAVVPAQ